MRALVPHVSRAVEIEQRLGGVTLERAGCRRRSTGCRPASCCSTSAAA